MSGPRNRKAFEEAQRWRAVIQALLEAHPPLAAPLTAKQVRDRLDLPIAERTVSWHIRQIRCGNGNSSSDAEAA